METKDINKQEYQLRINKVTDYIHNHIDQPLSLQKMAGDRLLFFFSLPLRI